MNSIDSTTRSAIRRFLTLLDQSDSMVGAVLYGSRARGTYRPDSDADLAILLLGEKQKTLPITLAMSNIAYDVLLETGINITPLPIWLDEWNHPERSSNPELIANIKEEGIQIPLMGFVETWPSSI